MKNQTPKVETVKEVYNQPLLTQHDALHALTGQSQKTDDSQIPR